MVKTEYNQESLLFPDRKKISSLFTTDYTTDSQIQNQIHTKKLLLNIDYKICKI